MKSRIMLTALPFIAIATPSTLSISSAFTASTQKHFSSNDSSRITSTPSLSSIMNASKLPKKHVSHLYNSNLYQDEKNDNNNDGDNSSYMQQTRRRVLQAMIVSPSFLFFAPLSSSVQAVATVTETDNSSSTDTKKFTSTGFSKQEYTNSITASRDTNISPKEAYDTISSQFISEQPIQDAIRQKRTPKALDLGAGAGVSTQLLYDMGYTQIDAVDWSGDAWRRFVGEDSDSTLGLGDVKFYEMDDERFLNLWRKSDKTKYDAIVYNFAVNDPKAKSMAMEMLTDTGKLLAPVNVQTDYWLKQSYRVYNKEGNMLWTTGEVGAWSVQFQPDVTQDTCQGIWCAPFNGFQKIR